jgi:hypothetical protein
MPFSLRVRLGQYEVEINGNREDVLRTVNDMPNLVAVISEAFSKAQSIETQSNKAGEQSTPQASTSQSGSASVAAGYPSIQSSGGCSDAVVRLLSTDWGKMAPRTLPEIIEAMRVNAVHYPVTTLSGVLNWLVRKSRVKRWKTEKGYVYVLAQSNVTPNQIQIPTQTEETAKASQSGG